jgi:XRE family aerobic/anaerobic benzoate catabolism transcriptional regulator
MNKILDKDNNLFSIKSIEEENKRLDKIGLIIKNFRAQRGISRKVLANRSGISIRYLAQLESGNANPTITILKNISYTLNMTLSNMFFASKYDQYELSLLDNKLSKFSTSQIKKIYNLIEETDKKNTLKKNKKKIALIGLRGAGKSTLGNMFHNEFNIPLFEVSNEIEKNGGMYINEIIELSGQGMYRRLEYDVISTLHKNYKNLIILTGGSIVSEKETYNYLLNNYFTIWIKANPKEHMSRVLKQGDSRPMGSNPRAMEDLNNILQERIALYSKADITINTEEMTAEESYLDFKTQVYNT